MINKIEPLNDRILLQSRKAETKTAGGLVIPQKLQQKAQDAVVVGVGSEIDPNVIKVGDTVIYDKYAGSVFSVEEEEFIVVKIDDVLVRYTNATEYNNYNIPIGTTE